MCTALVTEHFTSFTVILNLVVAVRPNIKPVKEDILDGLMVDRQRCMHCAYILGLDLRCHLVSIWDPLGEARSPLLHLII